MRKLLFVHKAPGLKHGLERLSKRLEVEIDLATNWQEGRNHLFNGRYDLVLADYDTLMVEGLDSFVLLDNVLQKEQTPGLLLATRHLGEANEFADTLASIRECLAFSSPDIDTARFIQHLESILAEAPVTPASAAQEGKLRKQESEAQASEASEGHDALTQSEATVEPGRQAAPIEVDVRLPKLSEGDLRHVPLSRLLYTLYVHRSTGILELTMGAVERRFEFSEGRFMSDAHDTSQLKAICGAFAWSEGRFAFDERKAVSGKSQALLPMIRSGIEQYLTPRRVMDSLMPLMKTYPVATQLWGERNKDLHWPILADVLGQCDGETNLEKVLSALGAQISNAFLATYFARETDLLFFRPDPTAREVLVSYGPQVQYSAQAGDPDEERKKTKAYRASSTDRLALKAELTEYYDKIQRFTPHQIFGVWEGCGRKVVQERFYVMVKEHHPDVYGGNVTADLRNLIQKIFIAVKDAYAELMKIEKEQTVPAPEKGPALSSQPAASTPASTRASTHTPVTSSPRVPTRQRHHSTPIGLGRQPSGFHPDLEAQAKHQEAHKEKFESLAARHERKIQEARRERLEKFATAQQTQPVDRAKKLEALSKTVAANASPVAGSSSRPGTPADPAKENFNEGYRKFRNQQYAEALPFFAKARDLEGSNGLYLTFYAYTLFQSDAAKIDEAQKILEEAIKTGHRQALPDAHLFLGFLLKIKGQELKAHRNFEMALSLNPASVEAKREIRLYEMRHKDSASSDPVGFLKNIFKK